MVINTNITAQVSSNNLERSNEMLSKSLSRLSSGSKIISPADDAAGLAVSSRLDSQIQRLSAARSNVGNALSFTQTQDGFLKKAAKALDRMSQLTVLAQDVTKSDADRALYNEEFVQLADFVTASATREFNGVALFSATGLDVTVDSEGGTFTMDGIDLGTAAYTDATGSDVTTVGNAVLALDKVKTAITQLATDRAKIGAYQVRLNQTSDQLAVTKENLGAASSRIQDVDMAEESTEFAKANILVQGGTAMLAQANSIPQSVLKLLR